MQIEEAIKQKSFKNEYHKVGVNIIYTASWIQFHHSRLLKEFGLSGAQYNVLRILRGSHPKPVTVNDIIDRMLDKSSNASRIVEKLRLKDLVERVVCPEDRRAVNVKIKDAGLQLLAEIDKHDDDLSAGIGKLTSDEANLLSNLLDKLRG
jgi:DNA-binding MarR family transcriptional regulator